MSGRRAGRVTMSGHRPGRAAWALPGSRGLAGALTAFAAALGAIAAGALAPATASASDPRALVSQAVAAHGGEAGLRAWSGLTCEGEATYFFGTSEVTGTFVWNVRDGRMVRHDARITFRGAPSEFVAATTGRSAWQQRRGRIYDIPPDELQSWLAHRPDILLRAAAAPDAALAPGGPGEIEGEAMDVVVFTEDGQATRILLDPSTHLVRGLEYRALNFQMVGNAEEIPYKWTFGDYRAVDGVPFPHLMEEHREGVRRSRLQVETATLGAKPDPVLFARPAPDEEAREWPDQMAN